MKRFKLSILFAVLCMTACNKSYESNEIDSQEKAVKARYFAAVYPGQPETKGVAQKLNLWYPCSNIKVKFLDDPYNRAAEIENWAKEWEQHAGITFDFVTSGEADVRISFNEDTRYVSWSYTGTDCKKVTDQTLPTLSFAYFTDVINFVQNLPDRSGLADNGRMYITGMYELSPAVQSICASKNWSYTVLH